MFSRITVVVLLLLSMLTVIGFLFYHQEVKYWSPTPLPENYQVIPTGAVIRSEMLTPRTKKFLHFYNPECPCSRFNLTTYRSLIKDYSDQFDCYAVVQRSAMEDEKDLRAFFDQLGVKLIVDENKALASKMGVYATPQIVLLDENDKLYYRGNYNKTRYCTSPATNYGKIAMDSLIREQYYFFPVAATTAYGCELSEHTH